MSADAEIVAPGIGLPEGGDAEERTGLWQRAVDNIKSGNLGVLPVSYTHLTLPTNSRV